MKPRLLLVGLVALVSLAAVAVVGTAGADSGGDGNNRSYEVWLIDQEDRFNAGAGTLHVFDGDELTDDAESAEPESIDLGLAVRQRCEAETGSTPSRPHMLVFNGGDDDGPGGNTHAMIAYVASGHVAFLDAQTREPLDCIDVGAQAHAAWPTPDQEHLIVANQNGKQLNRIATDYDNDVFTLESAATLDLANCTTPSGAACQDPALRPDNAPICPRTTSDGAFTFVTLRGGGMFVVDHNAAPMQIVAEYTHEHVDDNGCGEMEARGKMYVNSGAGLTMPTGPGDEPYGHDVYAVKLNRLSRTPQTTPNRPRAELVYTRDQPPGAQVDAHAVSLTRNDRYLWWGDRSQNDVTVVDPRRDRVVGRFGLVNEHSADPAPDLFDLSPRGDYMFASLRGPNPSSGHEAFGSTP
ncbi:MAG TPA: hypothetical protein VGW14_04185, partial [Thermoleophilaceae bacterium]|nr:hypothetical protein [Thermoleophilaceae bacterium]